jgi:hypothetical protein
MCFKQKLVAFTESMSDAIHKYFIRLSASEKTGNAVHIALARIKLKSLMTFSVKTQYQIISKYANIKERKNTRAN